jgi:poly-gamma-glutamate capsule biosynthesis protein CapA/YwtB (metallophosphatase superfamily)
MRDFYLALVFFYCPSLLAQDTTRLSLLFLGDIMQHDSQIAAAYQPERGIYDYSSCFQYLKPVFESADLTIGNLELTLAGPPYKGYPQFSAPDALMEALKKSGVDVLVTANNHSVDRGRKGIERTIQLLDSLAVPHTGTFKDSIERANRYPLLLEKNGFRVGLLNYTYGTNGIAVPSPNLVNRIDTMQLKIDLDSVKRNQPDFIIVFFHWGTEYQSQPNKWQRNLAEFCFKNGVKIVIGAHPHVLQPMEWRPDTDQLVAYSLGNFVSGQRDRYRNGGTMLRVEMEKIARDSIATTTIQKPEYELQYVYRNAKKKYSVLPVRQFEGDTIVVKENGEQLQLKQFVSDSRDLFKRHNLNIFESTRAYEQDMDSVLYRILAASTFTSDSTGVFKFYGVEKDSLTGAWWVGKFYDLETAQAAEAQIRSKSAGEFKVVRFVRGKRDE